MILDAFDNKVYKLDQKTVDNFIFMAIRTYCQSLQYKRRAKYIALKSCLKILSATHLKSTCLYVSSLTSATVGMSRCHSG